MKRPVSWLAVTLGIVVLVFLALVAFDLLNFRRFLPLSDNYDWLAFVGTVLGGVVGGLLTYGGVFLTLRQQKDSDRARREGEDLRNRLSIMPLFEFAMSYDPADFDNSKGQLAAEPGMPMLALDGARFDDPDSIQFLYDLIINNVGLGHALLTKVRLDVTDNDHSEVLVHDGGFVNFLIKSGFRRDVRFYFYAPRSASRFADPMQYVYSIKVTLCYRDLLGNEYEQVLFTSIARGFYSGEDPVSGGLPFSSFHYADPPTHRAQ